MTAVDEMPSGGNADRILGHALRVAHQIRTNEDRNVELEPDYISALTVTAAAELAGAVVAFDGVIRNGQPIPSRWTRPGE
jgi:hypothetical protein